MSFEGFWERRKEASAVSGQECIVFIANAQLFIDMLPVLFDGSRCNTRHHPDSCVLVELSQEVDLREYYRHRMFWLHSSIKTRRELCLYPRSVPHRHQKRQKGSHRTRPCQMRRNARQRMRNLAGSAMRVLIEEVMREELEMCVGAKWGECTAVAERIRERDENMVVPTVQAQGRRCRRSGSRGSLQGLRRPRRPDVVTR